MLETLNGRSRLTSYSSSPGNALAKLKDVASLVRLYAGDLSEHVTAAVDHLPRVEELVAANEGVALEGRRMLDVGAGQSLVQMMYFAARGNEVVGIDRDLVVQGFDPMGYLRMAQTNGILRLLKTLGRKALRVDERFAAELHRRLNVPATRARLDVRQMDATRLEFGDGTFDFVYSMTVFQYLDEPQRALAEMVRVLEPGGVAYVDFMPYTGPTGCLDVRMLGGRSSKLPPWAHLRPRYADLVRESAHVNRLRLSAWRELFGLAMPGCAFLIDQAGGQETEDKARRLQAEGELLDYDHEELLAFNVSVIWRKPRA